MKSNQIIYRRHFITFSPEINASSTVGPIVQSPATPNDLFLFTVAIEGAKLLRTCE